MHGSTLVLIRKENEPHRTKITSDVALVSAIQADTKHVRKGLTATEEQGKAYENQTSNSPNILSRSRIWAIGFDSACQFQVQTLSDTRIIGAYRNNLLELHQPVYMCSLRINKQLNSTIHVTALPATEPSIQTCIALQHSVPG